MTSVEGVIERGYTATDNHVFKGGTSQKRSMSKGSKALRQVYALECCTTIKRVGANALNTVSNIQNLEIRAGSESICAYQYPNSWLDLLREYLSARTWTILARPGCR